MLRPYVNSYKRYMPDSWRRPLVGRTTAPAACARSATARASEWRTSVRRRPVTRTSPSPPPSPPACTASSRHRARARPTPPTPTRPPTCPALAGHPGRGGHRELFEAAEVVHDGLLARTHHHLPQHRGQEGLRPTRSSPTGEPAARLRAHLHVLPTVPCPAPTRPGCDPLENCHHWRYELRTSLWLIPSVIITGFVALGQLRLPPLSTTASPRTGSRSCSGPPAARWTCGTSWPHRRCLDHGQALVAPLTPRDPDRGVDPVRPPPDPRTFLATRGAQDHDRPYVGTFRLQPDRAHGSYTTATHRLRPAPAAAIAVFAAMVDAVALSGTVTPRCLIQPATAVNRITASRRGPSTSLRQRGELVGDGDPSEVDALIARIDEAGTVVTAAHSGWAAGRSSTTSWSPAPPR